MKKIFDEINDLRQVINDIDDEKLAQNKEETARWKITRKNLLNL